MILCPAQPTTRNEAVVTYALADVAMVTGDFTMEDDGTGRKCTVAAKNAVPVDVSGNGNHIAFVDGARLLYVTTCNAQDVVAGNTVNLPLHAIGKVGQPT